MPNPLQIAISEYLATRYYLPTTQAEALVQRAKGEEVFIQLALFSAGGSGGDENVDGGTWDSVYTPEQIIDGGDFSIPL